MVVVLANIVACKSGDGDLLIHTKLGDKWGYIDRNGKWVINPQFDEVDDFSDNGLAAVAIDSKWGYIDRTGKWIVQPQFDYAEMFYYKDGLAKVGYNKERNEYGIYSYNEGLIDKSGKMIVNPYQYVELRSCYENGEGGNLYVVVNSDGKSGIIDRKGNYVIEPKYDEIRGYIEKELIGFSENGKYGFMDKSGNVIIKPQFDDIGVFDDDNNYVPVYVKDTWGYADNKGNIVIKPQFKYAWRFDKGLAQINLNDRWGYIDATGKIVITPQYDNPFEFTDNGLAMVKMDNLYGFIDITGKIVSPMQYINARPFEDNGLAVVVMWIESDKRAVSGCIDKTGKFVISPQYSKVLPINENLTAVETMDYKWGFADNTGLIVVVPKFDDLYTYKDIIFASQEGKWGIVDEQGNFIVHPQFDEISRWEFDTFRRR